MTDQVLTTTLDDTERGQALLQAVGFDKLSPAQRELALAIANRYGLDPMLKHIVMIEGRPYITRDGLLHVAHRNGQLDGIEVTTPVLADGYWSAVASVYRKDMSRPFAYSGRYPEKGNNAKYAPEMAVKVAEVMALRRAFDVAAPVIEERWDIDVPETVEPAAPVALADRIADRAAAIPETVLADAVTPPAPPVTPPEQTAPLPEAPTPATEPDLTLAAFRKMIKDDGIDTGFARSTAKRMFPDLSRFGDLTSAQLTDLYAELRATSATVDEALAETAAPDDVTTDEPLGVMPDGTTLADPEPEIKTGAIILCGNQSPLSDATCTLDKGHQSFVHRAGVSESW